MSLKVIWTNQFKRDYKTLSKRGYDMSRLKETVRMIAEGEALPPSYRDHRLKGDLQDFRECHIAGDWLPVYRVEADILVLTLTRTGTHDDVFG